MTENSRNIIALVTKQGDTWHYRVHLRETPDTTLITGEITGLRGVLQPALYTAIAKATGSDPDTVAADVRLALFYGNAPWPCITQNPDVTPVPLTTGEIDTLTHQVQNTTV